MELFKNKTLSRGLIRQLNIVGWGVPGLLMFCPGIYLSLISPSRDSIGGLTVLILYIAIFCKKRSVNEHISYLFEAESDIVPFSMITTRKLHALWFSHLAFPWVPFFFWGKDSILFLALLNIDGLLYLTYAFRYLRAFSPNKVDL